LVQGVVALERERLGHFTLGLAGATAQNAQRGVGECLPSEQTGVPALMPHLRAPPTQGTTCVHGKLTVERLVEVLRGLATGYTSGLATGTEKLTLQDLPV